MTNISDAWWGEDARLYFGDAGNPVESWTEVGEVRDITPVSFARDSAEVTSRGTSGSSAGIWKEYIPTLLDAGEITFDVNWLPDNASQDHLTGMLYYMTETSSVHGWKTVLSDDIGLTLSGYGFLTSFEPNLPLNDRADASVTVKLSGEVSIAASS